MKSNTSSQMLKGILQGLMLIILEKKPDYGYGISKQLDEYGLNDIPKGTIYPLLTTMERKGLIRGEMQPSTDGPNRKYYSVTRDGEQEKQDFLQEWQYLSEVVNRIIVREDEHEDRRNGYTK